MITFTTVSKFFPSGVKAVSNLTFSVREGETLVLLGQSGSGKTTALRLINRLIDPTSGVISFNGQDIQTLNPIEYRRQIGYAIQHIGLFLHMTVEENIGVVPRLLGWPKKRIAERVHELLTIMGLNPDEYRTIYPAKLSGGQKQRIGVARALAADPPVILMDEPFGALDPILREQLQNEFLEIQSKIRKTVVFVTHDLSEAVKMGDRIALFHEGELLQLSEPEELIRKPANAFVEEFLGKDRFQLLLQTRRLSHIKDMIEEVSKGKRGPQLEVRSSLMEALVTFQLTESPTLSIYNNKEYLGELSRQDLADSIVEIL